MARSPAGRAPGPCPLGGRRREAATRNRGLGACLILPHACDAAAMALEGKVLPAARVRIDRGLGRVFLTALSGRHGGSEIAIDVAPSQMPAIAAAFGAWGAPADDMPAMSPEELEGIKARVMKMTRPHERFYPSDIAEGLDVEYDVAVEAIHSLEREGKVREIGVK